MCLNVIVFISLRAGNLSISFKLEFRIGQLFLKIDNFFLDQDSKMKNIGDSTHFYRIREEGDSGRPPPKVHLRTDDVT